MPVKTLAVDVVTASRDTPILELARTMRDEELGDLVIEEDGKPVGIVTDRDVTIAVADQGDVSELTAQDVMTPDPVTIREDATAVDLPAQMAEGSAGYPSSTATGTSSASPRSTTSSPPPARC